MKIDIHNHVFPENMPDWKEKFGYGDWCQKKLTENGKFAIAIDHRTIYKFLENCFWCSETRIADMNNTEVTVQALSTPPCTYNYWAKPEDAAEVCRFLNDDIARHVHKHPERFIGLGTLPLQAPELAIEEIKRCKYDLGFVGFEIGTHVNDWNLSSPELWPILATVEQHNCALFVHPWDIAWDGPNSRYLLPWFVGMPAKTTAAITCMILGGSFERFPQLKVCFAHGAGSFPYNFGRIEHGFYSCPDVVAVDNKIPPHSYLHRIYADSVVNDSHTLSFLVHSLGEDNIMLGSEYPFPYGESHPGKIVESHDHFTKKQKEKLLFANAGKFFGLDLQRFG